MESSLCRKRTPSLTGPIHSRTSSHPQTGSMGELTYNKWFIRPSQRMKRSVASLRIDRTRDTFYYEQIFRPEQPDPNRPFRAVPNKKLRLIESMPPTSVNTLDEFRRKQLAKQKRVPRIIEMLLQQRKDSSKQ